MKKCFIDLETTGVYAKSNAVIQIAGIIEIDGELKEEFNFTVRPIADKIIVDQALEVNRRTREEIEKFDAPQDVKDKLMALFRKYVDKYDTTDKFFFVGYNAPFDYSFLRQWFVDLGDKYFGSWFFTPPLDVMQLAAWHLKDKRHEMENFKLVTVAKYLGITIKEEDLHDAMADIILTRNIYLHFQQS